MKVRGTSICLAVAWLYGSACNIYDGKNLKNQPPAPAETAPRDFRMFELNEVRAPAGPIDARISNASLPSAGQPDDHDAAQPAVAGKQAPHASQPPNQAPNQPPDEHDDHDPDMDQAQRVEMESTEDAGVMHERHLSPALLDAGTHHTHEVDAGRPRPVAKASAACRGQAGFVSGSDGHCYFMLDAVGSWNVGRDHCYELNAHLATVTSERESDFVAGFDLPKDAWIGLSRFGAVNFIWLTSEALSFTNWKKDAPHAMQESGGLIAASTGLWTNRAVSELHPPLCETEPTQR